MVPLKTIVKTIICISRHNSEIGIRQFFLGLVLMIPAFFLEIFNIFLYF
jgi:hypothetical protein